MRRVPRELWVNLIEGDLRALYENLVRLNAAPAADQIFSLQSRLQVFKKNGRPMIMWLDEMYEMNLPTRQFKDFVCTGIQVPYIKSEDA